MKLKYILLLVVAISFGSCKKDFLAIKSNKNLVIPITLNDMQALLDNADVMNLSMPSLGEISADDYYLTYDGWNSITTPKERNAYIWAKDIYEGITPIGDWNYMYRIVFYANNVLEGLEKLDRTNDPATYDHIKGGALFLRAYAFYQLSQLFCLPYNPGTSSKDLGIPLRLKSDINLPSKRASVEETYSRIISDLTSAASLLPTVVNYKTRPGRNAAFAMLSKIYLLMQGYNKSLEYSDSAILNSAGQLIDFNLLSVAASYPIAANNEEVIFQTSLSRSVNLLSSRINIDSTLYNLYSNDDLRRKAFFTIKSGHLIFKGSYNGSSPYLFSGLALDEIFLNKAECLVRLGQIAKGIETLSYLMEKRYVTGKYTSITTTDETEALRIVLQERRKELLMRGIRWSDLRRLNLIEATSKKLIRILNNQQYELSPKSPNYVLPIQDNVIQLSGIEQNPRN
ncbi:MAG: RagB/SusD family nutrient uptake outer membrane protein [Ginsengibacter sp.]